MYLVLKMLINFRLIFIQGFQRSRNSWRKIFVKRFAIFLFDWFNFTQLFKKGMFSTFQAIAKVAENLEITK